MIAQKNLTHLFVVANAALVTTAAPSTARYLGIRKIGEAVCSVEDITANDSFQVLYYNAAGKLVVSPVFRYNDVVGASKIAPTSAVSQVSTIGYNGTDGDIVETNSGKYLVTLGFKDILKQIGNKRLYKYGAYDAGTSAKKYDVAIGLAGNLYANLAQDTFLRVVPKVYSSSTVTAGNGWASNHDATVVQYSKYITVGTNLQYATSTPLAVGDYIRIGSVGGGTALTSNVYRVAELTSSTVCKVDRPITEASGTYAGSTDDMEVIPKATAEASTVKWGISLTGNDSAAPFEVGKYGNNMVMFSLGVSADFSTTEVRLGTSPVLGKGTYKDIAQTDWFLQANRREAYRIAEYPVSFTSNCVSSDTYDYTYLIKFKEHSTTSVADEVESYVTLMITTCGSTASNDVTTCFTSILANFPAA